jgi:hypothetical protein
MRAVPQSQERRPLLRKVEAMTKSADAEEQKKREKIQKHFWDIVGAVEHINVPKLEDAIRKELHTSDPRVIQAQIMLMQTEGRIRVQEKAKVWIKQPTDSSAKNF